PESESYGRTLQPVGILVQGHCLDLPPTACEYVVQVNGPQSVQETEHEGNQQRTPEHGQGDRPELLPAIAAIHTCSLVELVGNDLQTSQQQECHKWRCFPDIDDDRSSYQSIRRSQ